MNSVFTNRTTGSTTFQVKDSKAGAQFRRQDCVVDLNIAVTTVSPL